MVSDWDNRWQLIADDGSLSNLKKTTLRLSTVEMPNLYYAYGDRPHYKFESCLFGPDDSDVVARYETKEEAIIGHNELCKEHGLS